MATTNRKPLTFNVSSDTYNHFAQLFPHDKLQGKPDCSESNLMAILESYENPQETNSDLLKRINDLQQANNTLQEQNERLASNYHSLEEATRQLDEQAEQTKVTLLQAQTDKNSAEDRSRELSDQVEALHETIEGLHTEIEALQAQEINWDKIRTTMQPFTVALLEETAARLTRKYGHEVTPMQILTDMFLRYTIDRWNEWFYKFVLKDSDILAIAQAINPDIRTIDQIRKAVLKK